MVDDWAGSGWQRFRCCWWPVAHRSPPIRTVIYPSYGVYSETPSTTLIASYCWTYDAERLGALIGTGQQEYEDELKALVLANLAAIHNLDVSYLTTRFREMYSWDWNHDPLAGGK